MAINSPPTHELVLCGGGITVTRGDEQFDGHRIVFVGDPNGPLIEFRTSEKSFCVNLELAGEIAAAVNFLRRT